MLTSEFDSIHIHLLEPSLADYVICWCNDPSDSLVNEAITNKNQLCQKTTQRKQYSAWYNNLWWVFFMKKMVKQTFQKLVRKTCENYEDDYFDLVVFHEREN